MPKKNKIYRLQLTYPYEGNKIYKTTSFREGVRKCYKEYRTYNDINDGLFFVTDLDKKSEYKFNAKNDVLFKVNNKTQKGGNDNNNDNDDETNVKPIESDDLKNEDNVVFKFDCIII
jgi:hypothetical protein